MRELFALPDHVHYLNCAYMGPLSRRVEAAGIAGIRRKVTPWQTQPADFFSETDAVRGAFARLINAPAAADVAIVPAVSYAIATVARNLVLAPGSNIVIAEAQFPSNVHAWRRLCRTSAAELRVVGPAPGRHRGESWNERLAHAIDERTAVVALPHVHWTDGTRFDLEQLGTRAREVGALLIIDGTQSIGALPFDVQQIRPDMVVTAAYKWLLGPYSIGAAWYGPAFRDAEPLEETWIGRADSEDFRALVDYRDDYQPGAARFDVGERSNFVLMPMLLEALNQSLEWQPARIQQHADALTTRLAEAATALGWRLEDRRWRAGHLVGLYAPSSLDLHALQRELAARDVHVSLRGAALRVSPHIYNEPRDIDALIGVLEEVS